MGLNMKNCEACGQALPEYGGLIADADRGEIRFNGMVTRLTIQEFEVFAYLLGRAGRTASKEMILGHLYQLRTGGDEPEIKIVDVYVCKLRAKLKSIGLEIGTSWGRGYWLQEPGGKRGPRDGAAAWDGSALSAGAGCQL